MALHRPRAEDPTQRGAAFEREIAEYVSGLPGFDVGYSRLYGARSGSNVFLREVDIMALGQGCLFVIEAKDFYARRIRISPEACRIERPHGAGSEENGNPVAQVRSAMFQVKDYLQQDRGVRYAGRWAEPFVVFSERAEEVAADPSLEGVVFRGRKSLAKQLRKKDDEAVPFPPEVRKALARWLFSDYPTDLDPLPVEKGQIGGLDVVKPLADHPLCLGTQSCYEVTDRYGSKRLLVLIPFPPGEPDQAAVRADRWRRALEFLPEIPNVLRPLTTGIHYGEGPGALLTFDLSLDLSRPGEWAREYAGEPSKDRREWLGRVLADWRDIADAFLRKGRCVRNPHAWLIQLDEESTFRGVVGNLSQVRLPIAEGMHSLDLDVGTDDEGDLIRAIQEILPVWNDLGDPQMQATSPRERIALWVNVWSTPATPEVPSSEEANQSTSASIQAAENDQAPREVQSTAEWSSEFDRLLEQRQGPFLGCDEVELLGQGGNARVFKRRRKNANPEVVKVPLVSPGGDLGRSLRKFRSEAERADRVRQSDLVHHSQLVPVREVHRDEDDAFPYIILEVEPETLHDRISNQGPFRAPLHAASVLDDIARACHKLGEILGSDFRDIDLSPGNIYLTHYHEDSSARFGDYGGGYTLPYRDEFSAQRGRANPETEMNELIASLGRLGIYMLGERLPATQAEGFRTEYDSNPAPAHRRHPSAVAAPTDPLRHLPPPGFDALLGELRRACSPNPAERHQNFHEFAESVRAAVKPTPTPNTTPERPAPPRQPIPPSPARPAQSDVQRQPGARAAGRRRLTAALARLKLLCLVLACTLLLAGILTGGQRVPLGLGMMFLAAFLFLQFSSTPRTSRTESSSTTTSEQRNKSIP